MEEKPACKFCGTKDLYLVMYCFGAPMYQCMACKRVYVDSIDREFGPIIDLGAKE